MKLYWAPKTRASRAAWMLEELGQPYDRVAIDIRDENVKESPNYGDFLAASPMGKVPALSDGQVHMAESAAICTYLADRYASGRLAPAIDHPDRGRYLYWMMYTPAVIEPAMSEKIKQSTPNPLSNGWGDFDSMIVTLEGALTQGPWLLGMAFCAADVMLGSSVIFLRMFDMLPESRVLNGYADRCIARPAFARAMALDDPE